MLDEEIAAFVFEQAFLKANLAAFDIGQDLLKLGQSFLETARRGLVLFGHVGWIIGNCGIGREGRTVG
jgi:hypothetical protein